MKKILCLVVGFLVLGVGSGWADSYVEGSENSIYVKDGKVGIGTMTPTGMLDISGGPGTAAKIHSNGTGYEEASLYITNSSGSAFNDGVEITHGAGMTRFNDLAGKTNLTINQFNGYVGIGTTTPTGMLDISGGPGTAAKIHSNGTGYEEASLFITNSSGSAFNDGVEITHGAGMTRFNDLAGKTNLTINQFNGNVGIGTTNPSHKLDVAGTIHANEIVVDTAINATNIKLKNEAWSDYVFENDYNLKPLTEVETFIKENKHLPEVPSADEIKDKGLNMSEMMATQMKKIEELTLHLIEQNKMIAEMKKENSQIKNELAALQRAE